MNAWDEKSKEQFNCILKTIPLEDAALMTARVWCKENSLKFDDADDLIARRWHKFFHTGSLESRDGKYIIQCKDDRENWLNVRTMSTKAKSIWLCIDRENSFMKDFKEGDPGSWKMAKSYVDALKAEGHKARMLLA
jgi:hypothetical protein